MSCPFKINSNIKHYFSLFCQGVTSIAVSTPLDKVTNSSVEKRAQKREKSTSGDYYWVFGSPFYLCVIQICTDLIYYGVDSKRLYMVQYFSINTVFTKMPSCRRSLFQSIFKSFNF